VGIDRLLYRTGQRVSIRHADGFRRSSSAEAVFIKPRMDALSKPPVRIRALMGRSSRPPCNRCHLDEAFLDMTGTTKLLPRRAPAVMLARLVRRMKQELGLTGVYRACRITSFWAKVALI